MVRYCVSVYGSCTAQRLHRVQKVINFGARVVTGRKKRDHISDAVHDLGWLSAHDLNSYHSLCLLKRVILTGEPAGLKRQLVTRGEHRVRPTRQDGNLCLPRIRSETGRRTYVYRAATAFNDLPSTVREGSLPKFKRGLKKYLLGRRV